MQFYTVLCSAIQSYAVLYSPIQCYTVLNSAIQIYTVLYSPMQIPIPGMEWEMSLQTDKYESVPHTTECDYVNTGNSCQAQLQMWLSCAKLNSS